MYMLELKKLCKKKAAGDWIALPIAGVAGAFTNTLLVMNLIYICFSSEFASAKNIALDAVYGVILTIICDERCAGGDCCSGTYNSNWKSTHKVEEIGFVNR